jgi:hypothetical protein
MTIKHAIITVLDSFHLHAIVYDFYRYLKYLSNIPLRLKNKKIRQQGGADGLPLPPLV